MRVSRNSTCYTLSLPMSLACSICRPTIELALLGKTPRTKFKNCKKLWLPENATHRERRIIDQHNEIIRFINESPLGNADEHTGGNKKATDQTNNKEQGVTPTRAPCATPSAASFQSKRSSKEDTEESRLEELKLRIKMDIEEYCRIKRRRYVPEISPHDPTVQQKIDSFLESIQNYIEESGEDRGVSHTAINFNSQATHLSSAGTKRRKLNMVETHVRSQKMDVNVVLPATHQVIQRSKLSIIESKAESYDRLIKDLTRLRYKGSNLGNRFFATAAAMVPQAGMSGVSTIAPMVVAAILHNAGIEISPASIVKSLPSNNAITNMVVNNAADTVILTRESIKRNPVVYISCDKGNKKGNKNLAKYLCWFCVRTERVKTFLLDVDCTDENSADIAKAMKHSLKRIFGDNEETIYLFGQCTDSGGGGTGMSLFCELEKLGLVARWYLVTSCVLHNIQTALRNGVQLVLGEGGLEEDGKGKMNAMQLLHGVYNIQNWCKHDELKDIYQYTRTQQGLDTKFKKLKEPIVTRW